MVMPAIDLNGKTFGYLTVLRREGSSTGKSKKATWLCQCVCGGTVIRESQSLRSKHRNNARHCGCRHGEHITTHGMSCTRPYNIWTHMRRRCGDKTHKDYPNYGGRGITVCAPWLESFDVFWADMSTNYAPHLSLGRIDNEGPYAPNNCRWETATEQGCNTRKTRRIPTMWGELAVSEAARRYGLKTVTLHARLYRYKWGVERALTTPVGKQSTTS